MSEQEHDEMTTEQRLNYLRERVSKIWNHEHEWRVHKAAIIWLALLVNAQGLLLKYYIVS